jgi:hypothetical protein
VKKKKKKCYTPNEPVNPLDGPANSPLEIATGLPALMTTQTIIGAAALTTAAMLGVGTGFAARTYTKHVLNQNGHHVRRRVHRPAHRALDAVREYPPTWTPHLLNQVNAATQPVILETTMIGGLYAPTITAYEPGYKILPPNPDGGPTHKVEQPQSTHFIPSTDHHQDQSPASDQHIPVNTELLAHLQTEAFLKPRNYNTALVLKNKAKAFLKDYDNSEVWKRNQVMACVSKAFEPCSEELIALAHMLAPAVSTKINYLNAVLQGESVEIEDFQTAPHETYLSMGIDFLRKAVSAKDKQSELPLD